MDEMNLTGPVCDSADKLTLPDLIGIPSSTCIYTADTWIHRYRAMLILVRYNVKTSYSCIMKCTDLQTAVNWLHIKLRHA